VGEGSVFVTSIMIVDNAARGGDGGSTERSGGCKNERTVADAGVAIIRDTENAAARRYAVGARSDNSSRTLGVIVEK
jgi:hypothetical protein